MPPASTHPTLDAEDALLRDRICRETRPGPRQGPPHAGGSLCANKGSASRSKPPGTFASSVHSERGSVNNLPN